MKEIKNKVNTNKITEGSIFGQLLLFFFPILFGTFFQQLYNTADTVFCRQTGTGSSWRYYQYPDQSSGGLFRWPFQWCDCSYFPVLWCQKAG